MRINLIVISVLQLLLWLSLCAVHCHVRHDKRKDELLEFSLPSCGTTPTIPKKRKRIAFISHESAIATFFHNPEQGSRDAANIVDVDIEWNRYLARSESNMAQDIHNAVNNASHSVDTHTHTHTHAYMYQCSYSKNLS